MSTARFNTLTDASGGNSMPVADINQGRAKAWCNLNGTGTIATRDSFNVASVTDNGTGSYTAAFTAALANANWSGVLGGGNSAQFSGGSCDQGARSVSSTGATLWWASTLALTDVNTAQIAVLGDT